MSAGGRVGERALALPLNGLHLATACVTYCASLLAPPQERDGEEAVDEGEGEGEEVQEHEARRRRGLTASASRVTCSQWKP